MLLLSLFFGWITEWANDNLDDACRAVARGRSLWRFLARAELRCGLLVHGRLFGQQHSCEDDGVFSIHGLLL